MSKLNKRFKTERKLLQSYIYCNYIKAKCIFLFFPEKQSFILSSFKLTFKCDKLVFDFFPNAEMYFLNYYLINRQY